MSESSSTSSTVEERPVSESLNFLFIELERLKGMLRSYGYVASERNMDRLLRNSGFYEKVQEAVQEVRKVVELLESVIALER